MWVLSVNGFIFFSLTITVVLGYVDLFLFLGLYYTDWLKLECLGLWLFKSLSIFKVDCFTIGLEILLFYKFISSYVAVYYFFILKLFNY